MKLITVATGGAFGAVARYWLSDWINRNSEIGFPLGTLTVNVLGSLLFGVVVQVLVASDQLSDAWRLLLLSGFMGAFTTFSTFSYETLTLMQEQQYRIALSNMVISVVVCVAAAWLGMTLTRWIVQS